MVSYADHRELDAHTRSYTILHSLFLYFLQRTTYRGTDAQFLHQERSDLPFGSSLVDGQFSLHFTDSPA